MTIEVVKENIYHVGARDWHRRLFDELIPLPDGTSYNAYLILGSESTALIDTVELNMVQVLFDKLDEIEFKSLDYIISNHAEQDHSGALPKLIEKYPEATIVTMEKCKNMLIDKMHLPDNKFKVVEDEETLSLGNKTLEFIKAPWVHWPETLLTYLQEDKILFPCDFMGSHWATSELFVPEGEEAKLLEAAKRYYAEIMMPFRQIIGRHLKKLENYEIDIIAPSHGPIHREPKLILDAYRKWSSDKTENEVIIPYESMYNSTTHMVNYLVEKFMEAGIRVKPFKLNQTDIGELAKALVDARTVILGSPTVLTGPHPSVAYAAVLTNLLRPKTKYASIIGSYGWNTNIVDYMISLLSNLKAEIIEPVLIKGEPRDEDYKKLDELFEKIKEKHQSTK